jgi:hypothetical protein
MKTFKISLFTLPLAVVSVLSMGGCDANIPDTNILLQPNRTVDLLTEDGARVPLTAGEPKNAVVGVTVTTKTIFLKFNEGKVEFKKLDYDKDQEIVSSDPDKSRATTADGEKIGIIADRDYAGADTNTDRTTESCTIYETRPVMRCYDRPGRRGRPVHTCSRVMERVAVGMGREEVEITTTAKHYNVRVTLLGQGRDQLATALGNYDDVSTNRNVVSICR